MNQRDIDYLKVIRNIFRDAPITEGHYIEFHVTPILAQEISKRLSEIIGEGE